MLSLILTLLLVAPAAEPGAPSFIPASRDTAATSARAVTARVIEILAEHLQIPAGSLPPETDFVRDLGADATDVAEALIVVYEAFGLPAPSRMGATTLAGIAAQVETALRGGLTKSVPTQDSLTARTVYYATDRRTEDPGDPQRAFGGERGNIAYGTCRVTLPASHRPGHLEGPGMPLFARWNAKKHVVLEAVEPLPEAAFWKSLGTALQSLPTGEPGDLLVFVHGFNTTFEKAARRTAQMAYDMAFPGTAMFFSWPSDGNMTRYMSDREDAEWSAYDLAAFLDTLAARPRSGRIHLIAHSMGNQVLVRALLDVSGRRAPGREPLVDNVILAAPDLDADLFAARLAPQIIPLARRWTLYVSDKDVALDASAILGVRRLGMPLPVVPGVETIDATGVEVTPWSPPEFHDYYATKLRVLADLRAVLGGSPPGERALDARRKDGVTYWVLR